MGMRTRLLPVASLTLLVVALGACGTDDDRGERGVDKGGTTSGPAAADLTEDWGCGYGFAVSDDAQETLLRIFHDADASRVARTVTLPDPAWDAEVLLGSDLAANWCSDVVEEPQAEVDETWRIVEGTLTFAGKVPPIDGSPADQPVRAELTGVVVEGPDGERIELGDLSLANHSWGYFAG